jgi:hypothetical protein
MIDAAVGKDLSILVKLELAANESICELAGFNRERTHVTSDLFVLGIAPLAKDDLEHAAARLVGRTGNQGHQVRRHGDWNDRWRRHREHRAREVDTRGWPGSLPQLKVLYEECRDDLHWHEGTRSLSGAYAPQPHRSNAQLIVEFDEIAALTDRDDASILAADDPCRICGRRQNCLLK